MKNTIISAMVCLLAISPAFAQHSYLKSPDEAKALSLKATTLFADHKISEVFAELKKYWPLPGNEIDNLEMTTLKTLNLVSQRYGEPESFIKVKEESIKDTGIRETYIVRYTYNAMRLVFTYYRNNNGWMLNSFSWDDRFVEEFEEQ